MLEKLIRSKAAVKILGVILFRDGLHLRDIARASTVSPSETKRELDILHSMGLLKKEKRGNQVIFTIDKGCGFFTDLKALYLKTEGVFAELKAGLANRNDVLYAFIYGSVASGLEKPHSDIDLLVVGSIKEEELADLVFRIQKNTGREINYVLWSQITLISKVKSPFLGNILRNKIIWIAGDEDGFAGIVAQRVGQKIKS
jgi:predicted nucleotidyltransferase